MNVPDLRGVRILAGMDNAHVGALGAFGKVLQFAPGQRIVLQDEPADAFFFVLEGQAGAYFTDPHGNEVPLRTIETGGYFGEIGLLESGRRTATVKAVGPCTVFRLDADSFQKLLKVPELAVPLLHGLSRSLAIRLTDITRRLTELRSFADFWIV
jgi:CRP-like cAMP-binding protein